MNNSHNNNRTLLVVAGLFVVLAVGWFATRASQPSAGVKTLAIKAIAKDAVKKITVDVPGKDAPKPDAPTDAPAAAGERTPDLHVVLEKDGAGWVVSNKDAPTKRFAVEMSQLDAVLDAIGEFAPGDRISSKADKLKEFELDDAQATHIVVEVTDGPAIDLLFGRAAKSGGTTVRQAGSNDVFVARGRLGALVKKDVAQWRKKSVIGKKAEDFAAVTVAHKDGTSLTVTATSVDVPAASPEDSTAPPAPPTKKTTWALTAPSTLPPDFRVDTASLSRLAASIAGLRATDFAEVTDDVAGFAAAHTVVTSTLADGGKVVLHLGNVDDKKRVYARVDGDAQIYLVPDYSAKNIDKRLDDLRDFTLFTATVDDVTAAVFTAGKTKVVANKGADGAWKLIEPKTAPADFDVGHVGSVVGSVLRLKGTRLVADADIGASDTAIELTLGDGKKQIVRFGKLDGTDSLVKGADGLVYATSPAARTRYDAPLALFKKPPPPPPQGGMGGMGGMQGLENLPPDVRAKLEASLKAQGMGN